MTNAETTSRTFQPDNAYEYSEMMDWIGEHSPNAETVTNADGTVTVTVPKAEAINAKTAKTYAKTHGTIQMTLREASGLEMTLPNWYVRIDNPDAYWLGYDDDGNLLAWGPDQAEVARLLTAF